MSCTFEDKFCILTESDRQTDRSTDRKIETEREGREHREEERWGQRGWIYGKLLKSTHEIDTYAKVNVLQHAIHLRMFAYLINPFPVKMASE